MADAADEPEELRRLEFIEGAEDLGQHAVHDGQHPGLVRGCGARLLLQVEARHLARRKKKE